MFLLQISNSKRLEKKKYFNSIALIFTLYFIFWKLYRFIPNCKLKIVNKILTRNFLIFRSWTAFASSKTPQDFLLILYHRKENFHLVHELAKSLS